MGMMDKVKFWKKDSDFGDLGNLDDFSLDDNPSPSSESSSQFRGDIPHDADPAAMGNLPPLEDNSIPGMQQGVPTMRESLEPSQESRDMSDQLGISSQPNQQSNSQHSGYNSNQQQTGHDFNQASQSPAGYNLNNSPQQSQQPQSHNQQQFGSSAQGIGELGKELEIIHAKVDAIRSSLESINQRLASLERIASSDAPKKYSW